MADTRNLTNSNTTNVKVKRVLELFQNKHHHHSNTTNVKVKPFKNLKGAKGDKGFKYNQC